MKDTRKLLGILFFGLLTAVVIYPFLHETGHSIAAFLLGAEVLEFNLFPIPNVLCNMKNLPDNRIFLVGLGGLFFPVLFAAVIQKVFHNRFWCEYVSFVLNGISLFASLLSVIAVGFFYLGKPIENEDVTQILHIFPDSGIAILIITIFITLYLVMTIIIGKPIRKCLAYFDQMSSGTP